MLRSDAPRNKIYLMSFNLTVVLSQLWNRGRQWPGCTSAFAIDADVFINQATGAGVQLWKRRNSVNPSATTLLTSARKDKQDLITSPSLHVSFVCRKLWGRPLTVIKKQRESFQLPNPFQYCQKVQRWEDPNEPSTYRGSVQISNKYSADTYMI